MSGEHAPALEVDDLRVSVPQRRGEVELVRSVSFQVERGASLALVGESGAGKSLTCYAAMGLAERAGLAVRGTVRLNGEVVNGSARDLAAVRGRRMAMIFQEPSVSLNPAFRVGAQIAEVVRVHRKVGRREAWGQAVEALRLAGVPNPERRAREYPHTLSGGLRQRAMIAMAISCEPEVLIADEATTALDVTIQAQILDLLRDLQARLGMALVVVTHDFGVVADLCDRVAVMYGGQIVEQGAVSDVLTAPNHPYTQGLLDAVPRVSDDAPTAVGIPGRVPRPDERLVGCRFAPRCAWRTDACTAGAVELVDAGSGRLVRCVRHGELRLTGVRGAA